VDTLVKGNIDRALDETERPIKDNQIGWVDKLQAAGKIEKQFNTILFSSGDSREPEQAGIRGALMGSFYTLLVTFLLSFPIGVATAVYLEEFAPKNRWTDLIEVNINNLAAVPVDCVRLARGWRCSSTSSACPAPRRWSADWC
jgi:phosphate transport system permease protein